MSGVYAVVFYSVARRRKEIGVRIALGAGTADVQRLILGEGARLIGVGLLAGLLGSLCLIRLLSSLLFGVGTMDISTFTVASLLLSVIAVFACYLPARRAAKTDPAIALRGE